MSDVVLFSPLDQFQIRPIINLSVGDLDFSFTNSSLFLLIALGFASFILWSTHTALLVPSRWQSVVELVYEFVLGIVREQIGPKGKYYVPLIFVLFLFIFLCNMTGMVPYSFTVTSHIAITFGLALALFIGVNVIAFQHHGLHFFSFFLPSGAPTAMAPLFVGIELFSYIFRVVSLSVRLFANMTSGHALLKILAGFGWTMLTTGGVLSVLSVFPLLLVFAITGLELAIGFLQAYVFCVLICLYIKDAIDLH